MSKVEMKKWAKIGREFIKNNPHLATVGRCLLDKVQYCGLDVKKL